MEPEYHTMQQEIQNLPDINPKTAPIRPKRGTLYGGSHIFQPLNLPHIPCKRMVALANLLLHQRHAIKALRLAWWLLYITHLTRVTESCCSKIVTHDLQKRTCGVSFAPVPEPLQKFRPTCILKCPMSRTMDNETLAHISAVPAKMRFQFWFKAAYL